MKTVKTKKGPGAPPVSDPVKMGFPKVQSVHVTIIDHFLETMEMKSLKKNLALKITILHLLRDPMIFKEGVQSLEGIQDYVV